MAWRTPRPHFGSLLVGFVMLVAACSGDGDDPSAAFAEPAERADGSTLHLGWTKIADIDPEPHGLVAGTHSGALVLLDDEPTVLLESQDGTWVVLSVDDVGATRLTETDPPDGCTLTWGHAMTTDGLAIACRTPELDAFVAVSSDLVRWDSYPVPGRVDFGALVGPGPDGGISVAIVEAEDPNTTVGSTVRVFTTVDFEQWHEIEGAAPRSLVDAVPQSFTVVDDLVVLAGATSHYDPAGVVQWPAVWRSRSGGPFVRVGLPNPAGEGETPAVAFGATAVSGGVVVVGGTTECCRPLAWFSEDGDTWVPSVVFAEPLLGRPPGGQMWTVATAADGTVLAGGVTIDASTQVYSSADSGHTWAPIGDGPEQVVAGDATVYGLSTDPLTVFRWDGTDTGTPAPDPSRTPQQTVLDLSATVPSGSGRIIPVLPQPDRPGFFLLRNSRDEFVALAMSEPRNGCRLVTAQIRTGPPDQAVVFTDPCHGSTYSIDGVRIGGPSVRGMGSYSMTVETGRLVVDTTVLRPGMPVDGASVAMPDLDGLGPTDEFALAALASFRAAARDLALRGDQILAVGAFHDQSEDQVVIPFLWGAAAGRLTVDTARPQANGTPSSMIDVTEHDEPGPDGFLRTTITLGPVEEPTAALALTSPRPIDLAPLESLLLAME